MFFVDYRLLQFCCLFFRRQWLRCRVGSRVGFAGWVCGFAGFAGCELRIAFKGVAFLISILSDINYYQMIIKGLIIKGLIIIIKGFGGDKYSNT